MTVCVKRAGEEGEEMSALMAEHDGRRAFMRHVRLVLRQQLRGEVAARLSTWKIAACVARAGEEGEERGADEAKAFMAELVRVESKRASIRHLRLLVLASLELCTFRCLFHWQHAALLSVSAKSAPMHILSLSRSISIQNLTSKFASVHFTLMQWELRYRIHVWRHALHLSVIAQTKHDALQSTVMMLEAQEREAAMKSLKQIMAYILQLHIVRLMRLWSIGARVARVVQETEELGTIEARGFIKELVQAGSRAAALRQIRVLLRATWLGNVVLLIVLWKVRAQADTTILTLGGAALRAHSLHIRQAFVTKLQKAMLRWDIACKVQYWQARSRGGSAPTWHAPPFDLLGGTQGVEWLQVGSDIRQPPTEAYWEKLEPSSMRESFMNGARFDLRQLWVLKEQLQHANAEHHALKHRSCTAAGKIRKALAVLVVHISAAIATARMYSTTDSAIAATMEKSDLSARVSSPQAVLQEMQLHLLQLSKSVEAVDLATLDLLEVHAASRHNMKSEVMPSGITQDESLGADISCLRSQFRGQF